MTAFDDLCGHCEWLWQQCGQTKLILRPLDAAVQSINKDKAFAAMKEWQQFLDGAMRSLDATDWKQELDARVLQLLNTESILHFDALPKQTQSTFLQITKRFVQDAFAFDEQLELEDIMQAMRNVWIILLLECMLDKPLRYHKAIFAYSMLYPYTDNFLDDPHISSQEKKRFNCWLSDRLKGNKEEMRKTSLYHSVDVLVSTIEETFDRSLYPQVYEALQRIQEGQILSLKQKQPLSKQELLRISIYKGGASVLADGYLMDGVLSQEEALFCMEYGFLLQVADDIQDMERDRNNKQYTLASVLKRKRQRLQLAQQLHTYLHAVLWYHYPSAHKQMQSFVEQNCYHLLTASIAAQLSLFPIGFARSMRRSLPMPLADMSALMKESMRWMSTRDVKALIQAYTNENEKDLPGCI